MPDEIEYFLSPIDDSAYYRTRFDFWNDVYGFKMTDMREQHLNEPMFDNINQGQMLSNEYCFKKIDLNTVKADDLAFVSQYSVKIEHDGELNGFVIWFGVGFSLSHVEIWLDGSPYSERRIFSQLIVFLKNKTMVKKGNTLWGTIAWKNEKVDKHKTDLKLSVNLEGADYKNVQYYTVE